ALESSIDAVEGVEGQPAVDVRIRAHRRVHIADVTRVAIEIDVHRHAPETELGPVIGYVLDECPGELRGPFAVDILPGHGLRHDRPARIEHAIDLHAEHAVVAHLDLPFAGTAALIDATAKARVVLVVMRRTERPEPVYRPTRDRRVVRLGRLGHRPEEARHAYQGGQRRSIFGHFDNNQ